MIQVPEIPQAFATGTVHAMITSSATGTSSKSLGIVKNYYLTTRSIRRNVVVVNERAFQRLSDGEKKGLTDAAAAAEKRVGALARARAQRQQDPRGQTA